MEFRLWTSFGHGLPYPSRTSVPYCVSVIRSGKGDFYADYIHYPELVLNSNICLIHMLHNSLKLMVLENIFAGPAWKINDLLAQQTLKSTIR